MAKIRIGYLTTLYHTSFILKGSDLIGKMCINASWRLFPNGPAMIEAFEKEEIDMGYIGLPPVMIGIGRGLKIKCVAGGHIEGTVLIGGKDYRSLGSAKDTLAQFKGRAIGTPSRGTIHDVILKKLIHDSGLDGEVEVKNYDWADFILDAMRDGEVDGGCGTPPLAVLAICQIGAKIILPPSKIWPYNPSYSIVATEHVIHEYPSVLEDFLKIHEDACNLIRKRPEKAAEMVAKALGVVEKDFVLEVFRVSPKYCASLPAEYIDSSMRFIPVLMEMGYLARELKREEVFYTKAIEKVHPERPHYEAC